jgi:hypothetical protein
MTFFYKLYFFLSLMSPSFSTRYIKPKSFTCYHSSSEHKNIFDTTDSNGAITEHTIGCARHPLPCNGHMYVNFLTSANNYVIIHVLMSWLISFI